MTAMLLTPSTDSVSGWLIIGILAVVAAAGLLCAWDQAESWVRRRREDAAGLDLLIRRQRTTGMGDISTVPPTDSSLWAAGGGHELVWSYDDGSVTVKAVCHEAPGADCRLTGGSRCGCEQWTIQRDPDGTPFHMVGDYSEANKVRHENDPQDECNIVLFFNESDVLMEDCADIHARFELARTPIEPVWVGDYYEWKPVAS